MSGDLGDGPPKNLRWGTVHASIPVPPQNTLRSSMFVGCARNHEQSIKRCHQGIIFEIGLGVFCREERVIYTTSHRVKMWKIWKTWSMTTNFGRENGKFSLKNVILKSWSAKFFRPPPTRRQVSAYVYADLHLIQA